MNYFRNTVIGVAMCLAAALLYQTSAQLSVNNGAMSGITSFPNYFPMGEISMVSNADATDITVQGTEVKVAGTTTLTANANLFDMPSTNRLRYTGSVTALMHVACTISYTVASGSNQELSFRLYKGGNPIAESEILDTCSAATGNESTAIHVFVSMAQNDYLELWCANDSGTGDITVKTLNLFALGMR